MTSTAKVSAATDLTLSAIVDGQVADAADVTVPFGEAEAAIDEARATLSVTANDTHVKNLDDAVTAGTGLAKAISSPGGDEKLALSLDTTGAATGQVLTKTAGGVAFAAVAAVPVGGVLMWPSNAAPDKWLLCYGQALSMTTYKALLDAFMAGMAVAELGLDAGTTVTADGPTNLFTAAGHGLNNDDVIMFSNSGGALPTGLSAGTIYYVRDKSTNDFKVALTAGGAVVDITDGGSGTHKFHKQFANLDLRGRFALGQDDMGGSSANRVTATQADNLGQGSGAETHTLQTTEIPAHNHAIQGNYDGTPPTGTTRYTNYAALRYGAATTENSANAGGGAAHNNMPPYLTLNFIVYTGV